jgi:type II secretory pathway pseudopilin PulG
MNTQRRSGFTIVELALAMGVLGLALALAGMVTRTGTSAYRSSEAGRQLEQNLHRALDRAISELESTGSDYLFPLPIEGFAYETLEYQHVILQGIDVLPGPTSRLAFEYETGEIDDGIDNNGNGLVDEGVLVLVRNVGLTSQQRVVLCHDVRELLEGEVLNGIDDNGNLLNDEPGFCIQTDGRVVTIRLSIEGIGPQGQLLVRTAESSARMRN